MKGKQALSLVCVVFILPLFTAKLVLDMGWYQKGVTNKGDLLNAPVRAGWLDGDGLWRLVYSIPKVCDPQCENALFQLNQIPIAVGRERERVTSLLLVSQSHANVKENNIQKQDLSFQEQKAILGLPFHGKAIYLVDPLNNFILAYPLSKEKNEQIVQSKGLLSDLRKLMKLSKVG